MCLTVETSSRLVRRVFQDGDSSGGDGRSAAERASLPDSLPRAAAVLRVHRVQLHTGASLPLQVRPVVGIETGFWIFSEQFSTLNKQNEIELI